MKLLLLIYACIQIIGASKKVLVYLPITGHSHLTFMGTVANLLQDEGYNVTLLMPMVDETLAKLTPLVKNIKQVIVVDIDPRNAKMMKAFGGKDSRQRTWKMKTGIMGFTPLAHFLGKLYGHVCDGMFHDSELLERLRGEEFEIGLSEPFFVCGFALFDHLNIDKMMSIDSHIGVEGAKMAHGDAITSSFLPAAFSEGSDNMSLWNRIENLFENILNRYLVLQIHTREMANIGDIYTKGRSWEELMRLNAYMFVNSNPLLDFPYPRTAKFIDVGGIAANDHLTDKNGDKLPEYWNVILSRRKSNVLISFGSNAKSIYLPEDMKLSLIKTFESMPDTTFIWKYENTSIDIVKQYNANINNVVLTEWMPQTSILADPRLDLFITHGGLASTTEVAFSGKPSIMVPVFGDQTRNARMLERHGITVVLNKNDLYDTNIIRQSIQQVLNDNNYKDRAQKLAVLLNNQPESPKQIFLKYFNFVAKFGKPTGLDSAAAEIYFFQYYYMDFVAIVVVSLFVFVKLFKFFCCSKKYQKVKDE